MPQAGDSGRTRTCWRRIRRGGLNFNPELRNSLFLPVIEEPEIFFAQALYGMALGISRHHPHDDQVAFDPQLEWRLIGSRLGPCLRTYTKR